MAAHREFEQTDMAMPPEPLKYLALRAMIALQRPPTRRDLFGIYATSVPKGTSNAGWFAKMKKERNGCFYDRGDSEPSTLKSNDGSFIHSIDRDGDVDYDGLEFDEELLYVSDQCECLARIALAGRRAQRWPHAANYKPARAPCMHAHCTARCEPALHARTRGACACRIRRAQTRHAACCCVPPQHVMAAIAAPAAPNR
jgi:hypothetical protein